jgi:hypothetical protein
MTFAFNIDDAFLNVLRKDNDVLRYVVKDDPLGEQESIGQDRDVIFAAGTWERVRWRTARALEPTEQQSIHSQQVHARRPAER